jgi:hypothetical protein
MEDKIIAFCKDLHEKAYGDDGSMYSYYLNKLACEYGKLLHPQLKSTFDLMFNNGNRSYNCDRTNVTAKLIGDKVILVMEFEGKDYMPIIIFDYKNECEHNTYVYIAYKEGSYLDSNYMPKKPNLEWFEAKGYDMEYKKDMGNLLSYGDKRDSSFVYKVSLFCGEISRCEIDLEDLKFFVSGILQLMINCEKEINGI